MKQTRYQQHIYEGIILFLIFIFSGPAWAADVFFNPSTITEGQTSTLTIRAEGRITDVSLPSLDGIQISQSQSSTSVASTLGSSKSVSHTLSFMVNAQKPGRYTLPSFRFKVDGKTFEASGLQLIVEKAKQLSNTEVALQQPDFFMERELSSQIAYVGEPVFETLKLYLKKPWQDLNRLGSDHSLLKVINVDQTSSSQVLKGGIKYNLVEIFRILIPLKSTSLDIGRYGIEVSYVDDSQKSQSYFNHFFRSVKTTQVIAPNKLLGINDPPKQGQPPDFRGFVGEVNLKSTISQSTVAAQESVTLTLIFEAQGWLSSLKAPTPEISSAFQIYDDKPKLDENISPAELSGVKQFPFFLIPLTPGTFELGTYTWSYFDPKLKTYKTLTTDLGTLTVIPSQTDTIASQANPNHMGREDANHSTPQNQDILSQNSPQIHVMATDIADISRHWPPPQPRWHIAQIQWIILICWLLMIGCLVAFGLRWWWDQRSSKALSLDQLKNKLLRACDSQNQADLLATLVEYTVFKSHNRPEAVTAYDIKQAFKDHNVSPIELNTWIRILEQLEKQQSQINQNQWQQLHHSLNQWTEGSLP